MYVHVRIYIYIYRERERYRERYGRPWPLAKIMCYLFACVCIASLFVAAYKCTCVISYCSFRSTSAKVG